MTTPTLTWQDGSPVEDEDFHNQIWPLLDDLIDSDPSAAPDVGHQAREAALSALIDAAFGLKP